MASRSRTFAASRVWVGITALAAAVGVGLAAVPASASTTVNGAAPSAARATQPQASTPRLPLANLRLLEQRVRLAASTRGPRDIATASAGTISGTVLGANRQPFPGACVTAVGTKVAVTATAAVDGTFTLSGLAPGSYVLEYRDCAVAGQYFPAWSGGVAWRSVASHVQVAAYQDRHVPAVILKPTHPVSVQAGAAQFRRALAAASGRGLTAAEAAATGRISGLVKGNGKPLAGICVISFPVRGGLGYAATTDASGRYTIRSIRPGRYYVVFAAIFCPGLGNWLAQAYRDDNNPFASFGQGDPTPVTVTSGAVIRGINARLRLGGQISGMVTSKSGRKLGGICVNVNGIVQGGGIGYSSSTNANGQYQFHALFPGKYVVQFTIGCGSTGNYAPGSHRPVTIGYGQDVGGVDAVLGPGASVVGRVTLGTSSGHPLAGMCVYASNPDGSIQTQSATDAHGRYRVLGLGSGVYQLLIFPGCGNAGNYTAALLKVHTTAGVQTSGVNAVLQRGATISGTVTDNKGHPVPNMCIFLAQLSGANQVFGIGGATAGDGTYLVNQLPAGSYALGVVEGCGNTANYAPWWDNNQTDMSLATPIVLATGASQTINPRLQLGAAIAGTVTDTTGHGLAGICVEAVSDSALQLGPGGFIGTGGFAMTGAGGSYNITALAPGPYLVDFSCGQSTRYADQWFDRAAESTSADAVSATPGRTTAIDGVLAPAGAISGAITNPSGQPMADVCVYLASTKDADQFGLGLTFRSLTDQHGAYRITGLAAGTYDVQFQACGAPSRYAPLWFRHHGSSALMTPVRVAAGKLTRGIDARLEVGAILAGRTVSATGTPVANVCIFANDVAAGFFGFGTTSKSGTYTIPGMATGTYTVSFYPCRNQNLVSVLSHATLTAPHPSAGVDAKMVRGGSVAGVVTAASSGQPIAGSCVEVISSDPNNLGGVAFTAPGGSYRATGLAAGTYQVYFGDPGCPPSTPGLAPQWYKNQASQTTANPVAVTVGHTTPGINAALRSDGQITGTVSGPGNVPLAGICVTAVPDSANPTASPSVVAVSRTGGRYRLIGLLPGRYTVEFSPGCGASGYQDQWWQDANSAATAAPVNVAADHVVSGISARLIK